MSLNNLVKRLQDIMRNDAGINGDDSVSSRWSGSSF